MKLGPAGTLYRDAGWTLVRWSNHQVWRCPAGCCQVTCAITPSDPRSVRNARALLRQCAGKAGVAA